MLGLHCPRQVSSNEAKSRAPFGWSDAKAGVEQVNQDLMAIEEILEQIRFIPTEPAELRELAQQMSEQQQELQQRQDSCRVICNA